jgi:hypothetical protein
VARVGFERSARVQAQRLARLLGWSEVEAVGRLVFLWQDTQEIGLVVASAREIADWMMLDSVVPIDRVMMAMVECDLLAPFRDGKYRIRGNKKHIEKLEGYRERASLGGKVSARNRKKKCEPSNTESTQAVETIEIERQAIASNETKQGLTPYSTLFSSTLFSSSKNNTGEPASDLDRNAFELLKAEWLECLKHHGAERGLIRGEDLKLGRALQAKGFEAVSLAILGAKHEPASDEFKPSRHLSLSRIFDPLKFDRFATLGAQARAQIVERERQKQVMQATRQELESEPEQTEPVDRDKIRKLVAGLGVKIGTGA